MCVGFSCFFTEISNAQDKSTDVLFTQFVNQYKEGDLVNAYKSLNKILVLKAQLDNNQLRRIYINLGAISTLLGNYDNALSYYDKAGSIIVPHINSTEVADIYINKAIIFGYQKSYSLAEEYFEKGIRIYLNLKESNKEIVSSLSSGYLNAGIVLLETRDYHAALQNFKRSSELKLKYKLPGLALVYLNFAKTYVQLKNPQKAEENFLKSISVFKSDFGEDYYRMAEVYFEYGLFLKDYGEKSRVIQAYQKALVICLKNYGEKHTFVSYAYKLIGDDYIEKADFKSALNYYQKSIISIVKNFNDSDIYSNPIVDASLLDIRLLDNLKSKSKALELFANEEKDQVSKIKTTTIALETIDLALKLIDRIRNNYMSEESRIYLAENEKETYLFATHIACSLYSLTHNNETGKQMYEVAQKSKAAVLRNEISGNELLYSAGFPDSLRDKVNGLTGNIAAYNNLILDESRKIKPDSDKLVLWKDALFDMNREKEKVNSNMERVFPQYHDLIRKTEPVSLQIIQKKLGRNETIIDYLLSKQYTNGKRRLYVFIITRNSLEFSEQGLDSMFVRNAEIIRKTANPMMSSESQKNDFDNYTAAQYYMYQNLLKPIEDKLIGKKLIIIPDEEISWLPFDAFLRTLPVSGQNDYEGLSFLLRDYTFSYNYSSSLIFSRNLWRVRSPLVYAFSPDYGDSVGMGNSLSSLKGAGAEISSVYKLFGGKEFKGKDASKAAFLSALNEPAIFHLAMHSMSDSSNSKFSYLMFDAGNKSSAKGKLYNYEISLTRIKSPMVVLSACNSGSGTLYSGEGLMSLARGFILAGASSVIKTSWEINDQTSNTIMSRFYYHLSKGSEKDEAMQLAKLEYLKSSPPAYTNPYYWAAYEVLGDNEAVVQNKITPFIILCLGILMLSVLFLVYFRRRKILSARS